MADFDDNVMRITGVIAPLLAEENPTYVLATLTVSLASYITLVSSQAELTSEEVDIMIDGMTRKIKRSTKYQRAHFSHMINPGNA